MSDHVAAVCRAGYYRLWQLKPTVKSLCIDAAKTLIQAFISNRRITATLLSVVSLTPCLGSCSRFRMRQPGYSHELADENTLHRSWGNSTGYLSAVKSTLTLSGHMAELIRPIQYSVPVSPSSKLAHLHNVIIGGSYGLGNLPRCNSTAARPCV